MTRPTSDPGHLERLTRRLHITAYVSGGMVVVTFVAALASFNAFYIFALISYAALLVLVVSSVGAVVGRLLLAARRDDQSAGEAAPSQDWFE